MPRRKTLTDTQIVALKPGERRWRIPDPKLPGHYVQIEPSGSKSFYAVARNPAGKQRWVRLGRCDIYTIDEARELAATAMKRTISGEAAPETFAAVAGTYFKRHVEKQELISGPELERLLNMHILPRWGEREFTAIRRSDVAALLDEVEDDHGARQADYCLSLIRQIANWYAARNDDYLPPVVRGMRRGVATRRARILTDDELLYVWANAEVGGTFGAMVRVLLLTAQRRAKVASMRWLDIGDNGEWTIPHMAREKGVAGVLALPGMALDIIRAQPRFASNPHVFAGRGVTHFNGYSKAKARFVTLDEPWTLHDLRRTSRSLMSRAGVPPHVAERVMGHAINGVEGTYDRYEYRDEKAEALAKVAALVGEIVDGA